MNLAAAGDIKTRQSIARGPMLGVVAWLALIGVGLIGRVDLSLIDALFALAPLVMVPTALRLIEPATMIARRWYRRVSHRVLAAAVLLAISLVLSPSSVAGALAAPWLIATFALAVAWLIEVITARALTLDRFLSGAAFAYLTFGAGWAVVSGFGWRPLAFPDVIVELTAVHFHVAGFATLVIGTRVVKFLQLGSAMRKAACAASLGVVLGMPLVALGFTFSAMLGAIGAALLGASIVTLAFVQFYAIVPRAPKDLVRVLFGISSGSVVAGMVLGVQYAFGTALGTPALEIRWMAATHGVLNAVGFVLCGLVGWALIDRDAES